MENLELTLYSALLLTDKLIELLEQLNNDQKLSVLNEIKIKLHEISPMKNEPVDCVIWVKTDMVDANDYNPNIVAPPEMKLLELSIFEDGYTQPIVTCKQGSHFEVVDGFHRNLIARSDKIKSRLNGYLPVTVIRADRDGRSDRIASTIRHNRARGKHTIDGMSKIVLELTKRKWSDQRIGKELGMDEDEVLRLKQITGLAELFSDKQFSEAWEISEENRQEEKD
ncbi:MAG: ParB/RepB/Spo0J family partition protein [Anaerolineaceae bacterium]